MLSGYGDVTDVEEDDNASLMEVVSRSRCEVGPLPLSSEGAVLSRLTRMHGSKRLQAHFDMSELLEPVHKRIQASGCLMQPDFTMARTCIPLTEETLNETEIELGTCFSFGKGWLLKGGFRPIWIARSVSHSMIGSMRNICVQPKQ